MSPQPFFSFVRPLAVVAFGGNALLPPDGDGTQAEQQRLAEEAARRLLPVLNRGYELIVVHGNGPQVGNILIQVEEAADRIPPQTLDVCVAQTQGSMGFLLETAMANVLKPAGFEKEVVTIVTTVEVDAADPAFGKPTKPVGPFFERERAETLAKSRGWTIVEDAGRGWRKVVASPKPKAIRNTEIVAWLVNRGKIVIAGGGGGIPVVVDDSGRMRGVEAVIDKDYVASLLAANLAADLFVILTGVPQVYKDWGKPTQQALASLAPAEARALSDAGQFPKGSMGPKIDAALEFLEAGGREVLITDAESLSAALDGRSGTYVRNA
ncbi:MAG TPA: carbamate kinase [Thermoanaerobaculia bacterium]|nr:carbamate kinase [Thermoanaerobaculia bacterium]